MFGVPDKKFGPAEDEDSTRIPRKILNLVEEFSVAESNPRFVFFHKIGRFRLYTMKSHVLNNMENTTMHYRMSNASNVQ